MMGSEKGSKGNTNEIITEMIAYIHYTYVYLIS